MFLTELQPLAQELIGQPVAFLGGFLSGILKLNPSEDPLKGWLHKQGISDIPAQYSTNNNSNKPQSITID